jgi:hypothetical protein
MERERICPEREKSVLETTLFPSFFTRSENNNNLKKLLSLLSHHNVSEILHIITNFFQ